MSNLAFNVVGKSLFSYTDDGNVMNRLQHITSKVQEDGTPISSLGSQPIHE